MIKIRAKILSPQMSEMIISGLTIQMWKKRTAF